MNCQQFNKYIWDYADDSVSKQLQTTLDKHCEECPECAKRSQLTKFENEVLSDTSEIPSLPDDFAQTVMNNIKVRENYADLSTQTWTYKVKKMFAISAPLAILGVLLLVFYFYGNTYFPDYVKIANTQNNSYLSSPLDSHMSAYQGVDGMDSSVHAPTTNESNIPPAGSANPSGTRSTSGAGTSNNQPEREALDISKGSTTDHNTSRSMNNLGIEPSFSEYPLPTSLPDNYTVTQVTNNTHDQQLVIHYQTDENDEGFILQIEKVSYEPENSEAIPDNAAMKSNSDSNDDTAAPAPLYDDNLNQGKADAAAAAGTRATVEEENSSNRVVDWPVIHQENEYVISLSGNLPEEELEQIANDLQISSLE